VGAGTTVTRDVPAGALVVTRTPPKVFEGWVTRRRAAAKVAPTTTSAAKAKPAKKKTEARTRKRPPGAKARGRRAGRRR
jgi:hypothetical protein